VFRKGRGGGEEEGGRKGVPYLLVVKALLLKSGKGGGKERVLEAPEKSRVWKKKERNSNIGGRVHVGKKKRIRGRSPYYPR